MRSSRKPLDGRDYLRAKLRRAELTVVGAMVAVAGIAIAVAEFL
ncbi:MAG: hypothetical protein OXH07_08540 [Chloroflexi bacterium]|nr:hypothetical protein [Chloroflexota bacterium]